MKYKAITWVSLGFMTTGSITAQQLDFRKMKACELLLDDVMELTDTSELKVLLRKVEDDYAKSPSDINKTRLGIIYHETALNLSFVYKNEYKGYAQRSYDLLTELNNSSSTANDLLPFIISYRASALALKSAETGNVRLLHQAFTLFEQAVTQYAHVSYLPEFLRGSVAENLPWFFFKKKRFAKSDFQSIIQKYELNANYANWKIMSFTYWAWANQRQGRKYRKQSLTYLDKAIALDPDYKAGRKKAEALKMKLSY